MPTQGVYEIRADSAQVAERREAVTIKETLIAEKTFHVDHYCIDSDPNVNGHLSIGIDVAVLAELVSDAPVLV